MRQTAGYGRVSRATDDNIIRHMHVAYKHTFRICNNYCFALQLQRDGRTDALKNGRKIRMKLLIRRFVRVLFSCRWATWETTHDGKYVWKV